MHPPITIFCAFTRDWAVDRWLENLSTLKHDPALTDLCFIIDMDNTSVHNKLRLYAEKNGYRSCNTMMNEYHMPNEVRIAARRLRIAEMKNMSKDLIAKTEGQYIISFEDDTVFENTDVMRLIQPIIDDDGVGFVEGVQCGRWGVKMIGAWRMDNPRYPTQAETIPFPDQLKEYEEITAGGWYGYATQRQLYLNCEYYTSSAQPWGPDVNFGVWLKNQGYKCLIDWRTSFGHQDHGQILYPGRDCARIVYTKNPANGRWDRTDHEAAIGN